MPKPNLTLDDYTNHSSTEYAYSFEKKAIHTTHIKLLAKSVLYKDICMANETINKN